MWRKYIQISITLSGLDWISETCKRTFHQIPNCLKTRSCFAFSTSCIWLLFHYSQPLWSLFPSLSCFCFQAHLLPGQSGSFNPSGCSHICRIYSFDSLWLSYLQFWLSTSLLCSRHNFYLLICHLHLDFYFAFSTSKTELIFHPNMFLFLFLPTLLIILSSQVRSSKFVI